MRGPVFTYNVTKPYPYRWFPWLAIIGGIVATALLSVINLAANGYEPSVVIVTDPDLIEHPEHPAWFQQQPWSQATKVTSQCQASILTVGSQFYTTNFGLMYEITRMYRNSTPISSYSYHNGYLNDCTVTQIYLDHNSTATYNLDPLEYLSAKTSILCTFFDNSGPVSLIIEQSSVIYRNTGIVYAYYQEEVPSSHDQPSLFWGYSCMITSNETSDDHSTDTNDSPNPFVTIDLFVPTPGNFSIQGGYRAFSTYNNISDDTWASKFGLDLLLLSRTPLVEGPLSDATVNISDPRVQALLFLDGLGKSLYFTILTDLGLSTSVNALASPQKTMNFFTKTAEMMKTVMGAHEIQNPATRQPVLLSDAPTYPSNTTAEFYEWFETAQPHVQPVKIATQYVCQVPKLKSMFSVVIGVVVADIVFLQVLWQALKLITSCFLERRGLEARSCSGCAKLVHASGDEASVVVIAANKGPAFSSSRSYNVLPRIVPKRSSVQNHPTVSSVGVDWDRSWSNTLPRESLVDPEWDGRWRNTLPDPSSSELAEMD